MRQSGPWPQRTALCAPLSQSKVPIHAGSALNWRCWRMDRLSVAWPTVARSEEHTSELQSLMRISYAVFCLKKKKMNITEKRQIKHKPIKNTKHNTTKEYQHRT